MSTYLLFIELPKTTGIQVGKLGQFTFPDGRYIYVGRAKKNLKARLERHRRKNKTLYWHIDYFLQYARLINIITCNGNDECSLARYLAGQLGITVPVLKFGSSDCSCKSHFFRWEGNEQFLNIPPGCSSD